MNQYCLPPTSKRVKINSNKTINRLIDQEIAANIKKYQNADPEKISQRIEELDYEWDTERVLETSFAGITLLSIALGFGVNKKWFGLGGLAAGFLLLHALQGWCPPVPLIRHLGVRSSEEIEKEKAALKSLRGDFRRMNNKAAVEIFE